MKKNLTNRKKFDYNYFRNLKKKGGGTMAKDKNKKEEHVFKGLGYVQHRLYDPKTNTEIRTTIYTPPAENAGEVKVEKIDWNERTGKK